MADAAVDAGSNKVTGTGTNSITFALPGTPKYLVQSVVVTVDNTAGAATTGTLTMADTDGTVIAKRRQGETVDAAATTTATWALRLAGNAGSGIQFNKVNIGGYLRIRLGAGTSYDLEDSTGSPLIHINQAGIFSTYIPAGGVWNVFRGGGNGVLTVFDDRTFQVACQDWNVTANGATTLTLANTTTLALREVVVTSNDVTWKLQAVGKTFTILDHSGNPIFRVDEDGALHGKTGKALTFDL